ncbi:MAG: Cell division-associated, ATP-dependent zinc metalloprotease FtsH [Nitrospira sp.]|nr:MAG: Cell division-associated, ATP-dependent zinc metalloprotease FtsH [Nitrospira sp.]
MARSDLIISLVRAGMKGDGPTLKRTVDAIVAEERSKQHNVLADRLEKMLQTLPGNGMTNGFSATSDLPSKARDFIVEVMPRRRLDDLVLAKITRLAADQLIEEQQRASILRSHSLEPRNRVLLVGPPGNGKTTFAEAIAESLAIPFFVVRYETMIGSFLGETASRMKRVFDYARTTPCVLFFDEFDALGKERGDIHETGEIKRVVSSLLMQIDDLPSYTVVIAATNHAELLDRAAWRRFQLRLNLPAPTQKELIAFLSALFEKAELKVGTTITQVVKALGKVSFSEAEEFFFDIARQQVLAMAGRSPEEIAREQLNIWAARARNSEKRDRP